MRVKQVLRWLLIRWKWLLWGLIVLICLGVWHGLCRGDQKVVNALTDQTAYARWETEDKPYAQASVYLPEDNAIPDSGIPSIRLAVENALSAAGVPSEDYPWFYAASKMQRVTLQNGIASSNVELTLITGDYFRIHPMVLRKGWYMSEDDVMHDRIVLDRQTAWDLFYSDDVVGQFLEWNGQRYQVAAVVDYPEGKYTERAAEDTRRAWVYADSPGVTGGSPVPSDDDSDAASADVVPGGTAGTTGTDVGYTCLEMVLPQPVKNFAVSTLQSVIKEIVPEDTTYTDNAGRFSLESRWNVLRHLSTRGISDKAIGYPYYENAAKLAENHLALRLIPEAILLAIAGISVLIWLILLNRKRTWGLYSIPIAIENAIDRRNARNYEARLRGEEPEGFRKKRRRKPKRVKHHELDYSSGKRRWRRK